jgi:hypothetical protein
MISSRIVDLGEIVWILRHFCELTKGATGGFCDSLGGPKRTPRPPAAIKLDGVKGFVVVVEELPLWS